MLNSSRSRFAIVAALGLAGSSSSAHSAVLKSKPVGTAKGVVGTDGRRFAAWRPASGHTTTVLDASDGHIATVDDPAGCGNPVIGASALLFTCTASVPGRVSGAWIVDLRTGLGRQAVAEEATIDDFRSWVAVGRRWLQALGTSYHRQASAFYDRATGRRYNGALPFGPRRQPDLDRSTLVRPICSPLRASTDGFENLPPEHSDGYVPLLFSGRWALDTGPEVLSASRGQRLVLKRCGTRHATLMGRDTSGAPAFIDGHVVWADGVSLLTYRLRDGRRRSYEPASGGVGGVWRLGHRALVAVNDAGAANPQQLLSVRLASVPR
jgi:hypothetical protein